MDKVNREEQHKDISKAPDRREYPRLSRHLHARFRRMDSMEVYKDAATDDISIGGFRVDVAFFGQPFQIGQVIEITIGEFQKDFEPLKAIGRVVWIKDNEDNYSHEIGIAFTYIRDKDKECITKYICEEEEQ